MTTVMIWQYRSYEMTREEALQRLKEEIQNAFEDLDNDDLDALYGTLLEISEHIIPHL